jgi:transposase InsO family protein
VGDRPHLHPPDEGWLYLSAIVDLFSRRVVGWAMGQTMTTSLIIAALDQALANRSPTADLIHHSDRGSQYASQDYRERLTAAGITMSMSRRGNCHDNACAESFWARLKTELIYRRRFSTRAEAQQAFRLYSEISGYSPRK